MATTLTRTQKITSCLLFDTNAEEAVKFYTSVFKDSKILKTEYYGNGMHLPEGTVLCVEFELFGQRFLAINGGPHAKFNDAISLMVNCDTQAEIDEYWEKLTSGGGKPVQCGWLKDKYGLSWQITPSIMSELKTDQATTNRVMHALMKMVKLDIAALKAATAAR